MDAIAFYTGDLVVYWSSVVIVLGILAGFCLAYSLYTAHSGRGSTMFVAFAFSLVFSVLISRFLHFYSHQEQYDGLFRALTDYSGGSYFLPGVVLGVLLGAGAARSLGFADSVSGILDAMAPGMALTFAMIRLSAFFTTACRGKISVTTHSLQHLPLASAVVTASGKTEYRFATYFITFLLLLVAMFILLVFYFRHHRDRMKPRCSREGHVFRLFIVLYGIIELVMDSTRNDSTFPYFSIFKTLNRFGSFVSLTQLFAAISILIVFIWYSKRAVAADGRRAGHWILWILFVAALTGVGVSEYLVQRHGDMYMLYYSTMSASALILGIVVVIMYVLCRRPKKESVEE
ncbi:MAG: prolipoprotein diacylglyceryl transferase [Eubacteriales bacterium]|nr:prolipoprotein diacylglyceryl transferase [Eubacteriales bacterium]